MTEDIMRGSIPTLSLPPSLANGHRGRERGDLGGQQAAGPIEVWDVSRGTSDDFTRSPSGSPIFMENDISHVWNIATMDPKAVLGEVSAWPSPSPCGFVVGVQLLPPRDVHDHCMGTLLQKGGPAWT